MRIFIKAFHFLCDGFRFLLIALVADLHKGRVITLEVTTVLWRSRSLNDSLTSDRLIRRSPTHNLQIFFTLLRNSRQFLTWFIGRNFVKYYSNQNLINVADLCCIFLVRTNSLFVFKLYENKRFFRRTHKRAKNKYDPGFV